MLKKITLSLSMICSLNAASEQDTYLSMQNAVAHNLLVLEHAKQYYDKYTAEGMHVNGTISVLKDNISYDYHGYDYDYGYDYGYDSDGMPNIPSHALEPFSDEDY